MRVECPRVLEAVAPSARLARSITRDAGGSVCRTTPKSIMTPPPSRSPAASSRARPPRSGRRPRSPRAAPSSGESSIFAVRDRRVGLGEDHRGRHDRARSRSRRGAGRSGSASRRRRPPPPTAARASSTRSGWNGVGVGAEHASRRDRAAELLRGRVAPLAGTRSTIAPARPRRGGAGRASSRSRPAIAVITPGSERMLPTVVTPSWRMPTSRISSAAVAAAASASWRRRIGVEPAWRPCR